MCPGLGGEWVNAHRAPKGIACTQQGAHLCTGSLPWKAQLGFFGPLTPRCSDFVHPYYPERDSRPVVLNQGDRTPQKTFGDALRNFGCHILRRWCQWHLVGRGQGRCSTSYRAAPTTEHNLGLHVNCARAEHPCSR